MLCLAVILARELQKYRFLFFCARSIDQYKETENTQSSLSHEQFTLQFKRLLGILTF